ncbi:MAG: metallophosphoesterase family protein [Candidatus Omnitrophota bacterium]|nr:metallophosphoesterase family protein [Candidatus Omnitrophota bacterium]
MKIGVLSDTHIPRTTSKLPDEIYGAFKDVDLILHAGDFTEFPVLDELKKLAKTEAVCGNMDSHGIQKALPAKRIIKAGKFVIGLIHGYGAPSTLMDTVKDEFSGEHADVIIFGHSHLPVNEIKNGILFFNPGSPTDKIFAKYNSYGILMINNGIKGEIIKIK